MKPGSFGKVELQKLMTVAIFLTTSGILTNFTSLLTQINFGQYNQLVMAAWNLFLAFLYLLAKDNREVPTPPSNGSV